MRRKKEKKQPLDNEGGDKSGRLRKDRTGIPNVSPVEAMKYVKKAYESIGDKITSFAGMAEAIGIQGAFANVALGVLSDKYGLLQRDSGGGWQIADLGRRVAIGDRNAAIEVLQKISILSELYTVMKDKKVDRNYIEDYINRKRTKVKANKIADAYLGLIEYIEELSTENGVVPTQKATGSELLKIMQLKYALRPPNEKEISDLASELSEELLQHPNPAIRVLAKQMQNNIENLNNLGLLIDSIEAILSGKNEA